MNAKQYVISYTPTLKICDGIGHDGLKDVPWNEAILNVSEVKTCKYFFPG